MASSDFVGVSVSQFSRRTLVHGAAWSIPVVAVAAHAPAFAASHVTPAPGSMVVNCRTQGQGNGRCQGYDVTLNFVVEAPHEWSVSISPSQITASSGTVVEIKKPSAFPVVISASDPSFDLWFCSGSSPDNLTLQINYTVYRTDLGPSSAVVRSFAEQVLTGIPIC